MRKPKRPGTRGRSRPRVARGRWNPKPPAASGRTCYVVSSLEFKARNGDREVPSHSREDRRGTALEAGNPVLPSSAMFASISTPPRFRESPDLAALIELYESNYVRLMRLAPELDAIQGTARSRVAGALDLYLSVDERFKYTTSLLLTYRFDGDDGIALEPRARINVYHDVRAAEVVSHHRRRRPRGFLAWRHGHMPEVQRRWTMNRFLNKWLRFCAHQGHLFLACTASRVEDPRLELPDP